MRRFLGMLLVGAAAHVAAAAWFRHTRRSHAGGRPHVLVVQGGVRRRMAGDEIQDAVVSVLMGGAELDLRDAPLVTRPARLDVLCVMGGIDLVVPEDWRVHVEVDVVMGGIIDRRTGPGHAAPDPDLVVTGRLVMGGIDISTDMPADPYESARLKAQGASRKVRA